MKSRKTTLVFALACLTVAATPQARADEAAGSDNSRFSSYVIVSDIDDTIKITNVLDKDQAVKNGIFGKKTFLGMSELYQELTANAAAAAGPGRAPNPPIVYMSGSPPVLGHEIKDMLVGEHAFPTGTFIYRPSLTQPIYDFKSAHFKRLAATDPLPFLALGDDTEKDPEVLHDFAAAHPASKVVALYIHQVTGRALPSGVTPFHTAFDVALTEFEAGRLTESQVERIGNLILSSTQPDLLFPSFVECPKDLTYPATPKVSQSAALMLMKEDVAGYIRTYCDVRGTTTQFLPPKRVVVVAPGEMGREPCPGTMNMTPAVVDMMNHHAHEVRDNLLHSIDDL